MGGLICVATVNHPGHHDFVVNGSTGRPAQKPGRLTATFRVADSLDVLAPISQQLDARWRIKPERPKAGGCLAAPAFAKGEQAVKLVDMHAVAVR